MSLDVYLELEGQRAQPQESAIYIREDGRTMEVTREEWDELFPGQEPVTVRMADETSVVFSANITHNLNTMADKAGIYRHLWRPEELGIHKARELIVPLHGGLVRLEANPAFFKGFNPVNGWGTYEALVGFVRDYLEACREYPDAEVSVSR